MADRTSTKLYIPHHTEENCSIAGILEQLAPDQPTAGRRVALLLHGTMGHKDYLFLKRLALRLPLDSFRFDFRGHHETPGTWRHGSPADDVLDLAIVVEFLKKNYGYRVDLVVGHSRGAVVAFHWLCTSEEGRNVGGFVNVAGRYRMRKIYDGPTGTTWKAAIESRGHYEWNTVVARKPVVGKIFAHDLELFASWDTSIVWDRFPATTDVLTLHGLLDQTVPPYDALIYSRALGSRTPGTHNLQMVEDADHNFTGRQDDVVATILEWWRARAAGRLTTGVWMTGERGRL